MIFFSEPVEILDKEEFDGDEGTPVPEENPRNAAQELGLMVDILLRYES